MLARNIDVMDKLYLLTVYFKKLYNDTQYVQNLV